MSDINIKFFQEISYNDVDIAGGKGASLGELTQLGIPVPNGFVVLSSVFDKFIEENQLQEKINLFLKEVDLDDKGTIDLVSENIRNVILSSSVSDSLKKEIFEAFTNLGSKFVAVRSSATSEDSKDAAWAGQLDTFLNTTYMDLIQNIKLCWASLYSPRAIFYQFEKKLTRKKNSVAVVVQSMIQSEISGVAFSVHPIYNDFNQIVIEAGLGLGEAVVSGSITPDNYVIEKNPLCILTKQISTQTKKLIKCNSGKDNSTKNYWKKIESKEQKLLDEEILFLSKIILEIEKHYGFPCDIEWAFENKKMYITQSRPITTIRKQEEMSIVQKFKNSILNKDFFILRGNFKPLFFLTDWLYFYDEKFEGKDSLYPILTIKKEEKLLYIIDSEKYLDFSKQSIERYIKNNGFYQVTKEKFKASKEEIDQFYEEIIKNMGSLEERNLLEKLSLAEKHLHELVSITLFLDFLNKKVLEKTFQSNNFNVDFEKIYSTSDIFDFDSFEVRNNKEILRYVGSSPSLLKHVYTGYSSIISDKELEENLSKIDLLSLKKKVEKSNFEIEEKRRQKNDLRKDFTKKEQFVEQFISWIMEMRDERKILMNKINTVYAEITAKLFEFWNLDKDLVEVSFVFETSKGRDFNIKNMGNLRKRKGGFANIYYGKDKVIETYSNIDALFDESKSLEKTRTSSNVIKGQIANKGQVKGIVSIVYDPKKPDFKDGAILVTGMTRPEFVPLMKKASAIITNEGGITCHAAIISRELNIPCIIGTSNATEILKDGNFVEVNADIGEIKLLSKDSLE